MPKSDSEIPTFFLGDFNSLRREKVYPVFTGQYEGIERFSDAQVIDALNRGILTGKESSAKIDKILKKKTGLDTTYHGFNPGRNVFRDYIDWILYRPATIKLKRFEIVTFSENGQYPSDHYPVYAEFLI